MGDCADRPRPQLLDLYCGVGGASAGYAAAGFDVVGIDIKAQPHYPYTFYRADAIEFAKENGRKFDAIAASPPCQRYSHAQRIRNREHPDLIGPTRETLAAAGRPYVIENVEDARDELVNPVILCGAMFGLETYRHRLFEAGAGFKFNAPAHPRHTVPVTKMGRAPREGEYMHIVGNFIGAERGRQIMGMPWATRNELREAIPPAYTKYIGTQLMAQLNDYAGAAP